LDIDRARGVFVAQNTAVHLLDDITGEPAGETIGFALDGVDYEIDLSAKNAGKLRQILDPFVSNGRRTGGRKRAPRIIAQPKPVRAKTSQVKADAAPKRATGRKAAAAKEIAPLTKPRAAKATASARPAAKAAPSKAAPKNTSAAKAVAPAKIVPLKAAPETATPAKPARRPVRKAPPVTFSAAQ
jgi:Lsr2